ncbi:MAG: sigma-70 family RNA polymerase sigma factor [Verrucomicrobiae bacterium]|nr:sigma-70 family RNA polymerase sigma factor [Verrucomicrobiae bacterium]
MNDQTDAQLLRAYAEHRSEPAFAELVRRHVAFVHSAAGRMVCDSHLAQDVTQGVFVALAKNAAPLADRPVLSGWLHRTAQNIAAQTVRTDVRRRVREQEAATMNELLSANPEATWEHLAPHLDAALGELNEAERDALLLRYFEKKSAPEMAGLLGISEEAAQKRVTRAVERLRELFSQRKLTIGAGGLVVLISANAVQAVPAGLVATITATAFAGAAVTSSTVIATTKTIAMTTLQKTLVAATVTLLAGAGVFEARQSAQLREQNQALLQQQTPLLDEIQRLGKLLNEATNQIAALRDDKRQFSRTTPELLKLRGENTRLRNDASQMNDPFVQQALGWKANEAKLRKIFADHPEQGVPELALVSDDQWFSIAKNADLNSETGIRQAQSEVRHTAKNNFMPGLSHALDEFVKADDGVLPTNLDQLQPYFEKPVDEAILQQYKLTSTGKYNGGFVVSDKAVIDQEYDYLWHAGPNGYGPDAVAKETAELTARMEILKPALAAFAAANQGNTPTTISQIKSFITTPEQQAAFDRLIKDNVNFGRPQ